MQEVNHYTTLDQSIIRTLMYYDIFNYPLKSREVFQFLGIGDVTKEEVTAALDSLASQQYLYRFGELYSLQPDEQNVHRRLNGNAEAEKWLPKANKVAAFISGFPFVRAVMASGSLSKDYMDENSDLDFFVVTAPNRLWISRTLLVLYKRIFLNNSHKFFCANYFVDTQHMVIEEQNLFTATELATVIPLQGAEYYEQLLKKNNPWLLRYFPNFVPRQVKEVPAARHGLLKKIMEAMLNIFFGNALERFFMFTTLRRWKKLYQESYDAADFGIAFKTKKYVSKNHPKNFQKKVMERYQQKLEAFAKKFDLE
ncbi:hypothetical protein KK083_18890 [Fulvivirgaceae bacterium PWU4]|uniref:Nucleotidyltransferase domain-containing protein n=1 Tax=Chryseosolibacter histidini TaxID=2782349 RepID=A0AAP2DPI1_9BACT|nr:nucleotidyltransferase domain-containing protein [Chryseosolibacter histidini]MBT1698968.1 hypothetical protein [Chryseosolibacter histidini]